MNTMKNQIQEFTHKWIGIEGVVGIAEGKIHNKPCIHLYISKEFSSKIHPIPENYKGIQILVEKTVF
jgi:hypothetical protein